jgi:hypothetical protein
MSGADRVIKWSTAFAVLGVAAVAAVASSEHAYDLERAHSEAELLHGSRTGDPIGSFWKGTGSSGQKSQEVFS